MILDENTLPHVALDSYNVAIVTPSAFTGAANARGDKDGTQASFTLFTVTGEVLVRIFGVCTLTLVGAGTLEVGVAGNTAALLAQIADATILATNEIYNDATPTELKVGTLANIPAASVIVNGADIIETVAVADVTAGNVYYICLWRPLSRNGNVVPAV